MATSDELIKLYGDLRAALLARHFAIGRYFRANYLSLFNELGTLHQPGSQTSPDEDDKEVGCDKQRGRPSSYLSASDLLGKDPATQVKERWRVANHWRENPQLLSAQLLICLSVEHYLGRTNGVEPLILATLRSIRSMYKFQGPFRGYPLRWDAITSDHWSTRDRGGRMTPHISCEFLLANDRSSYLYCTPLQDPRYTPYIRNEEFGRMSLEEKRAYKAARLRSLELYRAWEPSMDELVGLICAYDVVYRLVDDPAIKSEVREQVNWLGKYLAEHSYLLVRPCGGFAARGASDVLPVFEFPWQRVFERITGNKYEPEVGFEEALDKAKVWGYLEGPMRTASIVMPIAMIGLGGLIGFVGASVLVGWLSLLVMLVGVLVSVLGIFFGTILGRALVVYTHRDCFDVWSYPGDGTEEFPEGRLYQEAFLTAYLMKKLPQGFRFGFWFRGCADHGSGPSVKFPIYVGLTGLDDSEGTVRELYLNFLPERRKHPELEVEWPYELEKYANDPFASAVAVVLGAGEVEERNLVQLLDRWYLKLNDEMKRDFALEDWEDGLVLETFRPALSYMASLALAWLHAKRRADAGSPIPSDIDFPLPLALADIFPEPRIPPEVLAAARDGELLLPTDTWGERPGDPPREGGLFGSQAVPPKQDEPPPPELKPPDQKQIVIDVTVMVTEADSDVDTGVVLQMEDELVIDAFGEIWAGVWGTGTNGPDGWNNIDNDLKFYVHGSPDGHPFALIGKIGSGGYFFVGTHFPANQDRYLHTGPAQSLWLRTNDDAPNNGSKREPGKAFSCRIRVWR